VPFSEIQEVEDQGFLGIVDHEFHFGHVEFELLLHIQGRCQVTRNRA